MSKTHPTSLSKPTDALYSPRTIDAKDRQDDENSTSVRASKVLGSRSRPMPSATVQKKKKMKLKGKVPKGLDVVVRTPDAEMALLDVWLTYKYEPTSD